MVLSQNELKAYVRDGRLKFYEGERQLPLGELNIGEESIDLRMGYAIQTMKSSDKPIRLGENIDDPEEIWEKETLGLDSDGKPEIFLLPPGEFVIVMTLESFRVPNHLVGVVEGRSFFARLGLSVHQTAPWLHPGWSGQIALEIYNSGKRAVELVPGKTRSCQVVFMPLSSPVIKGYDERQGARYAAQYSQKK